MARFAVFGDIHGRISLMLVLARRYEQLSGCSLDAILQVGDFGAFPDIERLDASTARHAKKDSDELGFSEYLNHSPEGVQLLDGLHRRVLWMRGNHEDFTYLSQFTEPAPVDPWSQLWFIPDGCAMEQSGLRIGAMGGMSTRHERRRMQADDPRLIPADLSRRAFKKTRIDVLLSHAGPSVPQLRGGSQSLTDLAQRVRPRVHLFGHHHVAIGPTQGPGGALLIGLDHLEFVRGRLQQRCWGILELDDDSTTPPKWQWGDELWWTDQIRRESYRGWISLAD